MGAGAAEYGTLAGCGAYDTSSGGGWTLGTASCSLSYADPTTAERHSSSGANATAAAGVLKVDTLATSGSLGRASSIATGQITGSTEIDAAGLAGTLGHFDVRLYYHWAIDGAWNADSFFAGSASVQLQARQGGLATLASAAETLSVGATYYDHQRWTDINGFRTESLMQPLDVTVDFYFGAPVSLTLALQTACSIQGGDSCLTDASHSLYWGGISNVRNDAGLVAGATIMADGDMDWARSYAPVPEPSTSVLLVAGILGIFATVTRRRDL